MLVSTPLGQLVSDGVPTSIVQAVAGVLVTLVASWELYSKRNWFLSPCNNMKNKGNKDCEKCYDTAERGESKVEEARSGSNENEKKEEIIIATEVEVGLVDFKTQLDSELFDKVTTTVDTTNDGNNEESSRKDQAGATTPPTPKTTISSVYASLAINPNNKNISITESSPQPNNNTIPTTQEERLKIGINKATFITLLAGGASGFLGGLVAIPGPPLLFYFLHPPHPITFNKSSQRATGVVILFCNVLMRMIFYFVNTFSLKSSASGGKSKMGFVKEDWRLYLSVIVCSIVGGFVGSKMFEYLKDSQDTIRGILAVFLLLCGVSLLFSAFA